MDRRQGKIYKHFYQRLEKGGFFPDYNHSLGAPKNVSNHFLKACYFMKVGLVGLSTHSGKIKFEFLVMKIQILFSRHVYSSPKKADFLKTISL